MRYILITFAGPERVARHRPNNHPDFHPVSTSDEPDRHSTGRCMSGSRGEHESTEPVKSSGFVEPDPGNPSHVLTWCESRHGARRGATGRATARAIGSGERQRTDRRGGTDAGSAAARHPAGGSARRRTSVSMSGGPSVLTRL